MRPFKDFPHVLESQQFEPEHLTSLFEVAEAIRSAPHRFQGVLVGRKVALLFSQPSSRTRGSFQLAAELLGASVHVQEHMAAYSSVVKGESLEDTIRTFMQYGMQYFIVRWDTEGSVAKAAEVAGLDHPVINAGDGPGQHPTQALLDVYTVWKEFKSLDRPLVVGIIGDLENSRTVHSLVYLLSKFEGVGYFFISPPETRMKPGIIDHLKEHNRHFVEVTTPRLLDIADAFDVLYVTRPQKEYQANDPQAQQCFLEQFKQYIVDAEIAEAMKETAIIMHPFPRNFELAEDVDQNPRARYFQQIQNGLWLRAALLDRIEDTRMSELAIAR